MVYCGPQGSQKPSPYEILNAARQKLTNWCPWCPGLICLLNQASSAMLNEYNELGRKENSSWILLIKSIVFSLIFDVYFPYIDVVCVITMGWNIFRQNKILIIHKIKNLQTMSCQAIPVWHTSSIVLVRRDKRIK